MLEIGDFFGINTDLKINPNSIPYPVQIFVKGTRLIVLKDYTITLETKLTLFRTRPAGRIQPNLEVVVRPI